MNALFWMDNRTLLLCQCIVIAVFTVMLAGMRSFNPKLRGISSIAAGFSLGLPAAVLLTAMGRIPLAVSYLGGGALVLTSSIFLFRGIVQFCEEHRPGTRTFAVSPIRLSAVTPARLLPLVIAVSLLGFSTVVYYSLIDVKVVPCIVGVTAILAFNRGLMAWALYRCADGRMQMRAFATSMAVFALLTGVHAVETLLNPASSNLFGQHSSHTLPMLAGVIFYCIQGVFYLLMFAGDITDSLHAEAQRDHLSGTLNRRGIEDALRGEMARARRTAGTFAVMLIDIDHFKQVNDRYGHAAGDESLRRVARVIGETIRVYDSLGRYGGDEFLLVMPEVGGEDALHTAIRIRDAVRAESVHATGVALTLSLGLTCCSEQEEMLDIVGRADAALYEAKRAGRDCARMRLTGMEEPSSARDPQLARFASLPGRAETV